MRPIERQPDPDDAVEVYLNKDGTVTRERGGSQDAVTDANRHREARERHARASADYA